MNLLDNSEELEIQFGMGSGTDFEERMCVLARFKSEGIICGLLCAPRFVQSGLWDWNRWWTDWIKKFWENECRTKKLTNVHMLSVHLDAVHNLYKTKIEYETIRIERNHTEAAMNSSIVSSERFKHINYR